ncbi:hypothetical protein [Denitromonas halophila]|uniref:hypothetical protein n=1 Tax=Denitromonas halophila TaxID=1629404 RepID=UPI001C8FE842|nr:hypothetical protein [Denitromonas halophila]
MPIVWRIHEARRPCQQTGTRLALGVKHADHHKWQLREKNLMLLRHDATNKALANSQRRIAKTGALLYRALTRMKD